MSTEGGLSLSLEAAKREDRRVRFARVTVWNYVAEESLDVMTDARGRMRYRLPDGEYRLSVLGQPSVAFEVRARRWTPVRLALI